MTNTAPSNKSHVFGKAVLLGRLNAINRNLDRRRDAYRIANKKTRDAISGKLPIELFEEDMRKTQTELETLYAELNNSLVEETTIGNEYTKEMFEKTLLSVLEDTRKQLGHQPNIFATLQMFVLLVQTNLELNAHFLHLRTQVAVEDRSSSHHSFYDMSGKPS